MELAEQADISMNFLSEIERGNKWPYPETLQNLAMALGVEVFELFKPEGDRPEGEMEGYMGRFSTDIAIAVEEAVSRSLENVRRRYGLLSGNRKGRRALPEGG
jgi:transcriptional regulator with XRE-family HTH domain